MGDILVFLTGQDDIDAAVQLLTEETQNHRKNSSGAVDVEALPIDKNFGCVWVFDVFYDSIIGGIVGYTVNIYPPLGEDFSFLLWPIQPFFGYKGGQRGGVFELWSWVWG